jgi:hypothetical protein
MNWITDMFSGKDKDIKKQAELTNKETEWERKVEANDWVKDVMNIDETNVQREADDMQHSEEEVGGIDDIMRWEEGDMDESNEVAMFQKMINDGSVWHMPGSTGRRAMELLRAGLCELGEQRFKDAYGNTVPSKHDVKPGTTGAPLETRNQGEDIEAASPSGDARMQEAVKLLKTTFGIDPNDVELNQWLSSDTTTPVADIIQQIGEKYDLTPIHNDMWALKSNFNVKKTAAYEKGDSCEDTIKKDYNLRVKGLSDYNLAEMLAEYVCLENNTATLNLNEEKESQLKSVKSGRDAAEKKLLKYLGDHTLIDWKKSFKGMEESEVKHPEEKDLYSEWKAGKMAWEGKKAEFEAPSDKEKVEQMEGVGKEEEKGQVGKEASLKKAEPIIPGSEARVSPVLEDPAIDEPAADAPVPVTDVVPGVTPPVDAPMADAKPKLDDKITQKIDEKIEEKAEDIAVKIEQKIEEHADEMAAKVEEKIEEKIEEAFNTGPMVTEDSPEDKVLDELQVPHLEPGETPESEMKEWKEDKKEDKKEEKSDDEEPKKDEKKEDEKDEKKDDKKNDKKNEKEDKEDKEDKESSLKTEAGFGGWKNYETWNIALWFDYDETLRNQKLGFLKTGSKSSADIANFVMELLPTGTPDFEGKSSRYLKANWAELADAWKEETQEPTITSQASKSEVIKKVAEIASPWQVIKNERGEEVIARVSPTKTEKKSKEKDLKNGINSQDLK